ncbi:MAG TPA: complex I NDUFA9 subunit family protein [Terriglobales bacterium]|nr:complex I NDUFA9 subunit family protein [Terriglobales bacterium]
MKVFLTGGTGFVGTHVLTRLLRDGHSVRALLHSRTINDTGKPAADMLEKVHGDICSANLADAMTGCDAVINLVGIIYEHRRQTFDAAHHQGTRNLVQAARQCGVRRFIQMSALGARPKDASAYHTSKFAAEEEVRNSGIPFVVLRPSLIVGRGSAFLQQMIGVMRAAPLVRPVPGTGQYRFRPVDVGDVAECFVQSLTNSAATGQTIDLVGGEELTLDELGDVIASHVGVHKRVVHIPMALMKTAAAVFSMLPIRPPVTGVQLRMLQQGSTADPGPMKRIFGIEPIGFRAGIQYYLSSQSN